MPEGGGIALTARTEALGIADRLGIDVSFRALGIAPEGASPARIDLAHAAEALWPGASLYKTMAAIALCRARPGGLGESVRVDPRARRVPGGAGLSLMEDEVTLTWREVMRWMLVGSDNTAAAVVLEEIGHGALAALAREAGMTATRIASSDEAVREVVGTRRAGGPASAGHAVPDRDDQLVDFARRDPILGSVTTARDQTRLLEALWRGELLPPPLTREVTAMLAQQTVPHRMNRTFCYPGVVVAGKTGSWGPFRHEAAVVTHDGEPGVAVCVLTGSLEFDSTIPAIDDGIGEIAAVLVNAVRLMTGTGDNGST